MLTFVCLLFEENAAQGIFNHSKETRHVSLGENTGPLVPVRLTESGKQLRICDDVSHIADDSSEYLIWKNDGEHTVRRQTKLFELEIPPPLQCTLQVFFPLGTNSLAPWLGNGKSDILVSREHDDFVVRRIPFKVGDAVSKCNPRCNNGIGREPSKFGATTTTPPFVRVCKYFIAWFPK